MRIRIIAEAGVNHNGSIDLAKKLVDVASEARADYVKFQTFKAENIIIPKGPKAKYHIECEKIYVLISLYHFFFLKEMLLVNLKINQI